MDSYGRGEIRGKGMERKGKEVILLIYCIYFKELSFTMCSHLVFILLFLLLWLFPLTTDTDKNAIYGKTALSR